MAKGNWRDDLQRDLKRIMKDKGPAAFLDVALAMLDVKAGSNGEFKAQFVGQVCETVLLCLTQKYLEDTGHEGVAFPSAVLKDPRDLKNSTPTELDFVLVTPGFLLTTECKSFAREIVIEAPCTFVRDNLRADIYGQSKLHHDRLRLYGEQLMLPGKGIAKPPVFANAFVFSKAVVKDKRSIEDRKKLAVLTVSTLFDYYDKAFEKYSTEVFDYERAKKVIGTLSRSRKLHEQHRDHLGYTN